MTQFEAKDLIHVLLLCAQKAKSITVESFCGRDREPSEIELAALKDMNPWLFGKNSINLVEMLMIYDNKEELSPTDMFNALSICHKEQAVVMCYASWERGPLPNAVNVLKSMQN